MAGTGKRADSKKPSIWKDTQYFGKHGFISKSTSVKIKPVNIEQIEQHLHKYLIQKLISHENGEYLINLEKLGYNKLLGTGYVSNKLKINTPYASKSAIEKIKQAGGEVTLQ